MDGDPGALRRKLHDLLRQAAEVSVALDRAEGALRGVPHYSVIEARAHELGQELSREVQQRQMAEIVAVQAQRGRCLECGRRVELVPVKRAVTSVDGVVKLQELRGYCPTCRRSFFPSAGDAGFGCPGGDAGGGVAGDGDCGGDAIVRACGEDGEGGGGFGGVGQDDRACGA